MATSWLGAALVCLAGCAASAEAAYMPVPWVFTDPKNDPFNPLRYIADNTLTAIAFCACYVFVSVFDLWFPLLCVCAAR